MKTTIDEAGLLTIKSETPTEAYALKRWVEENIPHTENLAGCSAFNNSKVLYDWGEMPEVRYATVSSDEIRDRLNSYGLSAAHNQDMLRFAHWLRQEMIDRNCRKPAATPQAPPQLFNNLASAALSLLRAIDARQNNDLEWFTRELKCEHDKLEYVIKDAKEKLGIVD